MTTLRARIRELQGRQRERANPQLLTRRGAGLLGAALGLWLVSRAFGVRELSMLALVIVVLLVLAVAATRIASTRLAVDRIVEAPRLHHGHQGSVRIRLRNVGRLPTAILDVYDEVAPILAEHSRAVLPPLPAGGTAGFRYQLHGRLRGRWQVGPVRVALRDPFGLAVRTQRLASVGEVVVYPPIVALPPGLPLAGHLGTGASGRRRPLARGDDLSIVREYVRGDDLRKVHWRSTAHRGKLMVRQDEAPQHPQASLVLDLRAARHLGHGPASSLEYAVTAAASIAMHLAARSYAITLLTGPLTAPPRAITGLLALEQLAAAAPIRDEAVLAPLWQQLATGTAGHGTLLVVATVPNASELRQMVRAGRGFPARTALLIDAGSFRRRRDGLPDPAAAAAALRTAGWRVAVQRAGEPLDGVWHELLAQRVHRGTGA